MSEPKESGSGSGLVIDSDEISYAAYCAALNGEKYSEAYERLVAESLAGKPTEEIEVVITPETLTAARKGARAAELRASRKTDAAEPARKRKTFVRKVRPE